MSAGLERKHPDLLPINLIARRMRVPVGWLKAEAEAGRIPHLKAGKQILAHLATVEEALLKRAKEGMK